MDMTRRAALLTSAAIASSVAFPMRSLFAQETPRKGGVFTVHYGAEQRQLNPSLQASTGVYIIGGKIQEQRRPISTTAGKLRRCAGDELGSRARRQDHAPSSCATA